MVMSGSVISYGRGTAIVISTGMNTELGHIAKMIQHDETPDTPLQKRLDKTGKVLSLTSLFICLVIFIIGIMQNIPIAEMFMTSVS